MNGRTPFDGVQRPAPRRFWALARAVSAALLVVTGALAQTTPDPSAPAPVSVPASRQADTVAIITIEGPIDEWTAISVERRLAAAEEAGVDAVVIDIDTPGGRLDSCLRITNAIKASPIQKTTAWINPDAYSGGAIIALACRDIVINDPGAVGDAFVIEVSMTGMRGLSPDQRTKQLPVLLSDVVDSSRRNGHDEFLAQAIVSDGIELWLVEDTSNGRRYCVNEREYRAIFGDEPTRGTPILASVTGARYIATDEGPVPESGVPISVPPEVLRENLTDSGDGPIDTPENRRFIPASEELRDIEEVFTNSSDAAQLEILSETARPDFESFSDSQRARFTNLGYLCDGTNAVVMRTNDAMSIGFTTQVVRSDDELRAFLGAKEMTRTNMSPAVRLARFLRNPFVFSALVVMFLLGLAIEFASPGLVVPAAVALLALLGLMGPSILVGMSAWWEIGAVVLGILLIATEVLVLPGFGVFGVLGFVSLFVGLVGAFVPGGGLGNQSGDLVWGSVSVLMAFVTVGVALFFLARHFGSIPILGRLVLADGVADDSDEPIPLSTITPPRAEGPGVGDEGVTMTPLLPGGSVEFEGEVADAIAEVGTIEPGERVRVTRVESFHVVVERIEPGTGTGTGAGSIANAGEKTDPAPGDDASGSHGDGDGGASA